MAVTPDGEERVGLTVCAEAPAPLVCSVVVVAQASQGLAPIEFV